LLTEALFANRPLCCKAYYIRDRQRREQVEAKSRWTAALQRPSFVRDRAPHSRRATLLGFPILTNQARIPCHLFMRRGRRSGPPFFWIGGFLHRRPRPRLSPFGNCPRPT